MKILITICSASGAYAKLTVHFNINGSLYKFFIPPLYIMVDEDIKSLNIYITYDVNDRRFKFMELKQQQENQVNKFFNLHLYDDALLIYNYNDTKQDRDEFMRKIEQSLVRPKIKDIDFSTLFAYYEARKQQKGKI